MIQRHDPANITARTAGSLLSPVLYKPVGFLIGQDCAFVSGKRRLGPGHPLVGAQAAERAEVHRLRNEGELDITIGCFEPGASRYRGKYLFEQTLSCCFNPKKTAN